MTNKAVISLRYIVWQPIIDLAYFPVWWYSRGAKKIFIYFWQRVVYREQKLGVSIWLVNLFRPMYSQRDWQSVLISFFVRLVQLIVRALIFVVWVIVLAGLFLAWLILPIFIIFQIVIIFL